MLNLTPYFERLLAALPFNEKLRKSFNIYIGDARYTCVSKTEAAVSAFLTAQAEQLSEDTYLHASYASSFNDLAYLAMRLSYLVAVESNNPTDCFQECRTDTNTTAFDSTDSRIRCAKKLLGTICTAHDWITQGKMRIVFTQIYGLLLFVHRLRSFTQFLPHFALKKKRLLTERELRKMAFVLYGANGLTLDTTGMHSTAWGITGGL